MKPIVKILAFFILLLVFSCRNNIPENEKVYGENIPLNNVSLVKINLLGVEFKNDNLGNNLISENNTMGEGNSLIYSDLQTNNEVKTLDDSNSTITKLANGIKYVIAVFDVNEKLADLKVCEVGKLSESLKLNDGKKYDIIIFSFNNSENIPTLSSINDNISFDFSDSTKEFLYYKINGYTATGGEKTLNITLKHKFSYAKFILDLESLPISPASINGTPKLRNVHYNSGKINVKDGTFTGNTTSDLDIPMKYIGRDTYKSEYIPISLSGNVRGEFVVEINTLDDKYEDNKKSIPVDIKSGTKNIYTMKIVPKITHIKPINQAYYGVDVAGDIKYVQGYNPAVFDPSKGFSVAKMKAQNKWFPTTGFKGAEFRIIGSGSDQRKYRCSLATEIDTWVSLSSEDNYNRSGENCRVTYESESKPTTPVTINLEQKKNDVWVKVDSYTINVPEKWAIILNKKYIYANADLDKATEFPALDACRRVGPRADYGTTTWQQATGQNPEDRAFRQKYMYRRDELTDSPYADPIKYPENSSKYIDNGFSRDIGTFTSEWGYLNWYYRKSEMSKSPVYLWTAETYSSKVPFVVDSSRGGVVAWDPADYDHTIFCRGE